VSTGFRDEPGSREPGLDQLIRALTADGYPQELAGRETALAAFRTARSQARPRRQVWLSVRPAGSVRLGAVAGAVALTVAALTAAAYAQALPAPVQRIAYSVFSSFGVPDSRPAAPAQPHASPRTAYPRPAAGRHIPPSRSAKRRCPCAAKSTHPAIKGSTLTLTAARMQFPANGWDSFAGRLTYRGHPEQGVRVVLLERTAGSSGWRHEGSGVTGPRGRVRVGIPHLTQNASFEFASPNGAVVSPLISVTVVPHVSFWRGSAQPGINRLVAGSRFGDAGDAVVLEELVGGAWQAVASDPLDAAHQASFDLPEAKSAGHYYRALLPATSTHGASVSQPVHEPAAKVLTGDRIVATHPATLPTDIPGHRTPHHHLGGPVSPGPAPTYIAPTWTVTPGPSPSQSSTPTADVNDLV
jgi:hypothetical protein